jgi:hypothetical protein
MKKLSIISIREVNLLTPEVEKLETKFPAFPPYFVVSFESYVLE